MNKVLINTYNEDIDKNPYEKQADILIFPMLFFVKSWDRIIFKSDLLGIKYTFRL